jgi:DNA-directed RNA polymerase specialized sigma24 family protein
MPGESYEALRADHPWADPAVLHQAVAHIAADCPRRAAAILGVLHLQQHRARTCKTLNAAFPAVPPEMCEDAVQEAFVLLLERLPPSFADAVTRRGPGGAQNYLNTIAWRRLGAKLKRASWRCRSHQPLEALTTTEFRHGLLTDAEATLLRQASQRHGGPHAERVLGALLDVILGDRLGEAAERHGVRREYVSRAWHAVLRLGAERLHDRE